MLLSIMIFVKVSSCKGPALFGYNFGGMDVELHQCPYEGDKVVLWNVDLVKPSDATLSSRRVYWIWAPRKLADLYKFNFSSFACVTRRAGNTAARQSYCLSFDYMCWIRGASEMWMELINCKWRTVIAAVFVLILASFLNPHRNVGGKDKVLSWEGVYRVTLHVQILFCFIFLLLNSSCSSLITQGVTGGTDQTSGGCSLC